MFTRRIPSNSVLNKSNFIHVMKKKRKMRKKLFSQSHQASATGWIIRQRRLIGRHSGPAHHGSHWSNASSQSASYRSENQFNYSRQLNLRRINSDTPVFSLSLFFSRLFLFFIFIFISETVNRLRTPWHPPLLQWHKCRADFLSNNFLISVASAELSSLSAHSPATSRLHHSPPIQLSVATFNFVWLFLVVPLLLPLLLHLHLLQMLAPRILQPPAYLLLHFAILIFWRTPVC